MLPDADGVPSCPSRCGVSIVQQLACSNPCTPRLQAIMAQLGHVPTGRGCSSALLETVLAPRSLPPSPNVLTEPAAKSAAAWALQAVNTRGWATGDCHVLLPYVDMANHSSMPVAEVYESFDG